MSAYTVRIGTHRRKVAVPNYPDLLDQPTRETDDGAVILWAGNFSPRCADCKRGTLQWAEGGYVSWHRICDMCGSHWDLHPIEWGPTPASPAILDRIEQREALLCAACSEWCETCDFLGRNRCAIHSDHSHFPVCEYVLFRNGQGYVPLDPAAALGESGKTWGDFLALITPEVWAAAADPARVRQMANSVVVSGAWARRARFYSKEIA